MDTTDPSAKSLVQAWARWALVWLTFFPLVGVLVSIQFHNPEFLGGISWFTFGRLRPVHTNGVIFGSFTTAFIALLYYFLPRLCGTPLYKAEWGWGLLWLWNAFLVLGSLSLLMGYVIGAENAEFEWPLNILRYVVFVGLTIQVLGTIFRRRAARFYVSLWYALAAAIWTLLNLLIGNDSRAYVPSGIDPQQLTPLLRQYPQLIRVFAHPAAGSFPGKSLYNEVLPPIETVAILMPEFLDDEVLGLDGLEVHYPGHAPEHEQLMAAWAENYGLLLTGGSDCHDRVERPLGVTGVNQAELDALLARLR